MNIRKEIDEARNRPANEQRQRDIGYKHGVEAAAGVLDGGGFNATTTHEYRLGDVVLCKLNQTKRDKPRRNTKCLQSPEDALAQGYALALALMARATGNHTAGCEVARAGGNTIAECRRVGVDAYDIKALRKAGVS